MLEFEKWSNTGTRWTYSGDCHEPPGQKWNQTVGRSLLESGILKPSMPVNRELSPPSGMINVGIIRLYVQFVTLIHIIF
jgi:hypothetical protein